MDNRGDCLAPDDLSLAERRDALAVLFAEGFLHLVDNGLLAEVLGEDETGEDRGNAV